MGYTTEFTGALTFNKPVSEELRIYINKFAGTRHTKRDVDEIKTKVPGWKLLGFCGDLGDQGEYYIGDEENGVVDGNRSPESQPGLWCQWIIPGSKDILCWDGNEKFYNYEEWLIYLINNFFAPLGYVLNGTIDFQGEDTDDYGSIVVVNNNVQLIYGAESTLSEVSNEALIKECKARGLI